MSMPEPVSLPSFDFAQILPPFRFRFPTRMSVLPLAGRKLALVSPVPIDGRMAAAIAELGEVQFLIAPNQLHDRYLAAAVQRYPDAKLLAPPSLRAKRQDLRVHATLDEALPDALAAAVDSVRIDGAPGADEFVFFHRQTRTLVVTDLVFNIVRPEGVFANLLLFCVGCHARLASTRTWHVLVKDPSAAAASVERLLALPFETLVMAHGEIVREDARAKLERALQWFTRARGSASAGAEQTHAL
jgi:hypothetical protein